MKKINYLLVLAIAILFVGCERVQPNFYGVQMQNYGKAGKKDYTIEVGKVPVFWPGTELFQVPAWEQRVENKRVLHLISADNTGFSAVPIYSYKAIKDSVINLTFKNSNLGSGSDFMEKLEQNILNVKLYDIIKEESRRWPDINLMATSGSLKFEEKLQTIIDQEFKKIGVTLMTFSSNLDFSDKVKNKLDQKNEVNSNMDLLDKQINEQKKKNELALLKGQEMKNLSEGMTKEYLQYILIAKWDGKTMISFPESGLPIK